MPHDALHRTTLRVVAVAVLLVAAGCVAGPGGPVSPTTDSPTDSQTTPSPDEPSPGSDSPTADSSEPSPIGTPVVRPGTPLPNTTVDLPEGPKTAPERPDTLTEATVSEYAKTFEYRYVYNSLWYNQYSNITADCHVVSATEAEVGWKVVVSCTAYSNTRGPADGTESPTTLHADWFTQVYTYLIDEDSTVRRRATEGETE